MIKLGINNNKSVKIATKDEFFLPSTVADEQHFVSYKDKTYKIEHQTITDLQTGESEHLKDLRDLGANFSNSYHLQLLMSYHL